MKAALKLHELHKFRKNLMIFHYSKKRDKSGHAEMNMILTATSENY